MILKGNDALNKANKMFESLELNQKKGSFSNVEKIVQSYNGKTYGIVHEGAKYIIKEAVVTTPTSPDDFDYIEGVQNKSKYTKNTILEAERTLNLWKIEHSRVYGTSMLKEQEDLEGKKAVLKLPAPAAPAAPAPETAPVEAPVEGGGDMSAEMPSEEPVEAPVEAPVEGGEDMGGEEDMGETEDDYEDDPKKLIQKLAGKLAYELREFQGEDEEYGDIANFALGMVASAVKPEKLSKSDIKKIRNKVDKGLKTSEDDEELNLDIPDDAEGDFGSEEMPADSEEMPMDSGEAEGSEEVEESIITEKLHGKSIDVWIKDFMNSKNKKFEGKSKKKRREMAITAFKEDEKSSKKSNLKESYDKEYGMMEDEDYFFNEGEDLLLDAGLEEEDDLGFDTDYDSEYDAIEEDDLGFDTDYDSEDDAVEEDDFIFEIDLDDSYKKKPW